MVLAPMEQVTDCAFRRLCFELGASFTWTEMVRAAALLRQNNSTTSRIDTLDASTPTGVQLLVSSPEELQKSLELLEERAQSDKPHWARGIHGIDLNFGCPSPHIINDGLGPAMLNRPQLLRELFEILAQWRGTTSLPVGAIGAKMRLGLNEDEERREVYLRAVRYAKGRLDYIVLHPRHAREESKKSAARWEHIRKAKEVAGNRLAVIGNGDVWARADAVRMLRETGCDAVMVARGATRTAGAIFDPSWDDSDAATAQRAAATESRLAELTGQFGVRSKIAEYHKESFRRVRARGSRRALRLLWEELNWWLMRVTWLCTEGRRDVDHPHQTAFCRARRQTSFGKGPYISSCTGQLRRPSLERSGWCFAKEHRQLEEPISAEERQGCVTKFFAEEVRIQPLGAG
ncbi:unnamed protein product [Effrenium voratum]|uniref:tRNA-dihydrouridine(47) synthase [NAD(P)(+)] n=1 Tax=Effrenium voratum TaxID=2562239 RepID=A0AA36NJT6_9DINO|nr:unnamed protein product [Effrenium voratum]